MATLHFEDDELRDAAQALRLASVEAEIEADKQASVSARAVYDAAARRYRELAEKLERARMGRA